MPSVALQRAPDAGLDQLIWTFLRARRSGGASAPPRRESSLRGLRETRPGSPDRRASRAYGRLGLAFAPNVGQTDRRVRFVAQAGGASLFFTARDVTLALRGAAPRARRAESSGVLLGHARLAGLPSGRRNGPGVALRLRFIGANPRVRLQAGHRTPGIVSYLVGDRRNWRRRVPTFTSRVYRDLWPGIDVVFSGRGGTLK